MGRGRTTGRARLSIPGAATTGGLRSCAATRARDCGHPAGPGSRGFPPADLRTHYPPPRSPAPPRRAGGWALAQGRTPRTLPPLSPPPSLGPAQRRRGPGSGEGGGGRGGDSRSPPLRVATSLTYRPAEARSGERPRLRLLQRGSA